MAAAVVTISVLDLIERLSDVYIIGMDLGVKSRLNKIHRFLSSVQAALPEQEDKYGDSLEVRKLLRHLKVFTFEVEDLLEEVQTAAALRHGKRGARRLFQAIGELRSGWKLRNALRDAAKKLQDDLVKDLDLRKEVQTVAADLVKDLDLREDVQTVAALRHGKRGARRLFQATGELRSGWKLQNALRDAAKMLQDHLGTDPVTIIRNIPAADMGEVREGHLTIIGRDDEKRDLKNILLDGGTEGHLAILAVVGHPGSGKTALIRELYSDSEVGQHFQVKIWLNASPPFDENRMAQEIIGHLTEDAPKEENVVREHMLHQVTKLLDATKKYLFVLDDLLVPNSLSMRWLNFTRCLEGGDSGSKILVTTRDYLPRETSQYSAPFILTLGKLLVKDSLDLLLQTASKRREEISEEMLEFANELAAECDGSPMIIQAVGGYLSLKSDADPWSRFRDELHHQHKKSVFSSLLFGGYPTSHLSPLVNPFNGLQARIKQCFGLCSLFPRGHAMDRETLAALWMALGYIKPSKKDTAYEYLDRLVQLGLFLVKMTDISGKTKSVVLNPYVEDLARSVAGWECRAYRDLAPQLKIPEYEMARHLSITPELSVKESDIKRLETMLGKLQTFLYFVDEKGRSRSLCDHVIPHLKRARVLDVHHINTEAVPGAVWKLKHLKYLNFSSNRKIKTLPLAITGLRNLQTLKLSGCCALEELPFDMQKMVSLMHLYIDGCWRLSHMPKGLGELKSLHILTDFILPLDDSGSVDYANLADLCELKNLSGSLRITNLGYSESESVAGTDVKLDIPFESLELRFRNLSSDEKFLEKLWLHKDLKELKIHNFGGARFPQWIVTRPESLVDIALIGCENCVDLPLFPQLHNLKFITIQGMPDLERMGSCSPDVADDMQSFRELSSLCIRDCPKLKSLPKFPYLVKLTLVNINKELFSHSSCRITSLKTLHLENINFIDHFLPKEWLLGLTSLEELHIGSCPLLASLSQGMRYLMNLKYLSIWNCRSLDLSKDEYGNDMELQGLKSLQSLTIYKASKLKDLSKWLSYIDALRFLSIRSCPSLTVLPEWIENLQSLELVHCPLLQSLPESLQHFDSTYGKKLTIVGCPLVKRGSQQEEAGKYGHEWIGTEVEDWLEIEEEEEPLKIYT